MGVYDAVGKLGDWSVRLDLTRAPAEVLEALDYFEHVVVLPGQVPDGALGDDLLPSAARWAGIIRRKTLDPDAGVLEVGGPGMAAWLGDEDDKGAVIEAEQTFSGDDFATVVAALLPDAVTAGTITNPSADVFSGSFQYVSPRTAIDYVCGLFDAYYRVRPDGTLDAGAASDMFTTTPAATIARRADLAAGQDEGMLAATGAGTADEDADDYTTRVVLLAEDDDTAEAIATGSADAASVPYLDMHGNAVVRTRVVNEEATSSGNAAARAQLQLNRFSSVRRTWRLELADYDVDGAYQPGDTVYVFDPVLGLVDADTVVDVRGRTVTPTTLAVQSVAFPLVEGGWTVAHRTKAGGWVDLTPYVVWESSGGAVLEVGDLPRKLTAERGVFGRRYVRGADVVAPNTPAGLTVTGTLFQTADGATRAALDVAWTEPTNPDGSTVVDGDRYEVRFRRAGSTDWQYVGVPWGTEALRIVEVASGETYEVAVAARDTSGNASAWSGTETEAVPVDPDAPPTPATPTASASPLRILVTHDLTAAAGGNLDDDLDHLEVHVSASSGFTPSAATLAAKLPANAAMIAAGVSAVGVVPRTTDAAAYVKVVAVDRTGNASAASAQVAASASLIDTAQIADAAIGTAKIGLAQITTATIADLAVTDAKVASLDAAKITTGYLDAARIAAGSIDASAITAGTITADRLVVGSITSTQIANGTIGGVDVGSSTLTGGNIGSSTITGGNIGSSTITGGNIGSSTITGGNIAAATISGANIANATITNALIADATITSAKIASLAADKITTGTLSASTAITVASGGYIQSAGYSSGSGFRLNGNGTGEFTGQIQTTNFAGANAVRISGGAVEIRTFSDEVDLLASNPGELRITGGSESGSVGDTAGGFGVNADVQVELRAAGTLHYAAASGSTYMLFPDSAFVSANVHINSGGGGNLFRATSSRANKRGEVLLDRGLALQRVRALRATSFQSVLPGDHERFGPDHRANGFIAEDLAAISPTLVHYERPKRRVVETRLVPTDGRGLEPREEREVVHWVEDPDAEPIPTVPNTMALLAELVTAVQELDARVAAVVQGGR